MAAAHGLTAHGVVHHHHRHPDKACRILHGIGHILHRRAYTQHGVGAILHRTHVCPGYEGRSMGRQVILGTDLVEGIRHLIYHKFDIPPHTLAQRPLNVGLEFGRGDRIYQRHTRCRHLRLRRRRHRHEGCRRKGEQRRRHNPQPFHIDLVCLYVSRKKTKGRTLVMSVLPHSSDIGRHIFRTSAVRIHTASSCGGRTRQNIMKLIPTCNTCVYSL